MIQYDAHKWSDHLCDIRGSMVREIIGRVTLCVIWAALICACDYLLRSNKLGSLGISETAHSLMGAVLGLLLVFRTNASYDRFWEGRKLWGSIVNESRNLARVTRTWLVNDPQLANQAIEWVAAYPWAVKHRLRGTKGLSVNPLNLDAAEVEAVVAMDHPSLEIAHRLSRIYLTARDRGIINDWQLISLEANVQRLIDYLGACERIQNTPMPFAYMVHLRRALIVYCFTLPFAMLDKYRWGTLIIVMLFSYIMFGIEEIGVEIENPFGEDENDLPLERLCENIEKNVKKDSAIGG